MCLGSQAISLRWGRFCRTQRHNQQPHQGTSDMITRRFLLQSSAASAAYLASGVGPAWTADAPGVSDTEIKIGQTIPYSGPASAYGVFGRCQLAYFKMINEQGGINGRKLRL